MVRGRLCCDLTNNNSQVCSLKASREKILWWGQYSVTMFSETGGMQPALCNSASSGNCGELQAGAVTEARSP
jgi:hypothetical protein